MRLEAAVLFDEGVPPREVARRLRVTAKSAYQWHQAWREYGAGGLASRGPGGQRCKLSARCREKLAEYLEQGPAVHGWDHDQVWTSHHRHLETRRESGQSARKCALLTES
ncbi:helix-turn-helix domain-containing protein [Kitasatospora sp. NPDC058170]|uniref:helix-turn-helix domain-containing protein n=1 Tax=Kitasatospora sp. NPDC058170 TaxID=3346364 RepID=UPI0036D75E69